MSTSTRKRWSVQNEETNVYLVTDLVLILGSLIDIANILKILLFHTFEHSKSLLSCF